MSGPGLSIDDLPNLQEEARQRINSGRFYRFTWSIHLPKWMMLALFEKLPPDAMLVAAGYEIQRNVHSLVIWSNYFPARHESMEIEEITAIANTETREVSLNRWNPEIRNLEEVSWPTS